MVAGFIAMLKVALMGVLMATLVAPFAGTVDTTDGTTTTSWPHPAAKTSDKAASQYVKPNLNLRMRFLLSKLFNCGWCGLQCSSIRRSCISPPQDATLPT
jgi:hypothetical protein